MTATHRQSHLPEKPPIPVLEPGAAATAALWRSEIRAMFLLAWPMVLINLGQTAMTATGVLVMGRLGPRELAGGALGANIYFAPLIFGLGLMIATSPMIASELGRKRNSVRDVRRTVRQGLWAAVCVTVPIWLLLWNTEDLLLLMGQERDLSAIAGIYVRALQWGLLPFLGYVVLRSFITALERPGWALVVAFVAVVFNAFGNWVLVFGNLGFPAMGIQGSGLATSAANGLMFVGLALVLLTERQFRRYRLFGRFWRPDWPRFFALIRLGMPIAGILLFEVTIFNLSAILMGLIDAVSLAAYAIAFQIASISFMVPLGLNQAVTIRVGRAYGANNEAGIFRAGWTAYGLGVGFMVLTATIMITWPLPLISAFVDAGDPANAPVMKLAVTFLTFAALFQVADGAQAVASGMLRGIHDTTVPMIYAAFGYWGVGMPLGALLAFHFDFRGVGIWIGLSTGLTTVALLLLIRWLRRDRIAAPRLLWDAEKTRQI